MASIPGKKFSCGFCSRDVTNEVYISCAVCSDVELCLECFSSGVEHSSHRNNHDYHVVDNMRFTLYDNDWTADEEIRLLDAIDAAGFGNWSGISKVVQTKDSKECEQHYLKTYIHVPTAPLPDLSKGSGPEVAGSTEYSSLPATSNSAPVTAPSTPVKNSAASGGSAKANLGPAFASFHPKRRDFDMEYDNDAELGIRDIVFYDDDLPEDQQLKLAMIEIYNSRLEKRIRRKCFAVDYRLTDPDFQTKIKHNKMAEDVRKRLRVFCRYHSPADHNGLLELVLSVQQQQRRIKHLQECRKFGVRTLQEMRRFEEIKARREAQIHSQALKKAGTTEKKRGRPAENSSRKNLSAQELPLGDLLSTQEHEACMSAKVVPAQFISLKAQAVTLMDDNGCVRLSQLMEQCNVDETAVRTLFGFLREQAILPEEACLI